MVDPRARYDLAILWIYQEFLSEEAIKEKQEDQEEEEQSEQPLILKSSYSESVRLLLYGFKERLDPKDKYEEYHIYIYLYVPT